MEKVEALKGELEEAHRAALAAEHRAETEAASAERQRAAAQELTAELERVQVRSRRFCPNSSNPLQEHDEDASLLHMCGGVYALQCVKHLDPH